MTSMRIDGELLKKAKKHGINVSAFLEIKLCEYIALIEGKQNIFSSSPSTQEPSTNDDAEGGIWARVVCWCSYRDLGTNLHVKKAQKKPNNLPS